MFSGTNATAEEADETPKKRSKLKRKFPDFSRAFSRDNLLLSGDESEGWDDEQGNLEALLASQNELEIAAACNSEDPVDEIQEIEYLGENVEVEEGKADNNDEEEVFDLITVKIKTYTAPELKDVCRALSLLTSGNKVAIFAWIRESSNPLIERIDDESFIYKKKKEVEVANLSLPRWVVLNPDPAPKIDSINMLCGAQVGFFGPTNIENVVGAPKHQYCCREEEKVHRPEFASTDPNLPASDRGRVSMAARDLLPDKIRDCRPSTRRSVCQEVHCGHYQCKSCSQGRWFWRDPVHRLQAI